MIYEPKYEPQQATIKNQSNSILGRAALTLTAMVGGTAVVAAQEVPLPTNTPMPGMCVTASNQVNIRSGPGMNFDIIGKLNPGESLKSISGQSEQGWYAVQIDGSATKAYISQEVAQELHCSQVQDFLVNYAGIEVPSVFFQDLVIAGEIPQELTAQQVYNIYKVIESEIPSDAPWSVCPDRARYRKMVLFAPLTDLISVIDNFPTGANAVASMVRFDGTKVYPYSRCTPGEEVFLVATVNLDLVSINSYHSSTRGRGNGNYITQVVTQLGHEISHLFGTAHYEMGKNVPSLHNAYFVGSATSRAYFDNCDGEFNIKLCLDLQGAFHNGAVEATEEEEANIMNDVAVTLLNRISANLPDNFNLGIEVNNIKIPTQFEF